MGIDVCDVDLFLKTLDSEYEQGLRRAPFSRQGNLQVLADLACGELQDFAMARYAGHLLLRTVHVNGMVTALAQELAAVTLQVPDERQPLHAAPRSNGSRMTSWPCKSSSASSRLASKHHGNGFRQVGPGFFERRPLGVSPRQFLHEGGISIREPAEDSGEC